MNVLTTTAAVMDALGGNKAVADLTKRKPSAVSNWRGFPTFPANTFVAMTNELKRRGFEAAPSLWGMVEAPVEAAP